MSFMIAQTIQGRLSKLKQNNINLCGEFFFISYENECFTTASAAAKIRNPTIYNTLLNISLWTFDTVSLLLWQIVFGVL